MQARPGARKRFLGTNPFKWKRDVITKHYKQGDFHLFVNRSAFISLNRGKGVGVRLRRHRNDSTQKRCPDSFHTTFHEIVKDREGATSVMWCYQQVRNTCRCWYQPKCCGRSQEGWLALDLSSLAGLWSARRRSIV